MVSSNICWFWHAPVDQTDQQLASWPHLDCQHSSQHTQEHSQDWYTCHQFQIQYLNNLHCSIWICGWLFPTLNVMQFWSLFCLVANLWFVWLEKYLASVFLTFLKNLSKYFVILYTGNMLSWAKLATFKSCRHWMELGWPNHQRGGACMKQQFRTWYRD